MRCINIGRSAKTNEDRNQIILNNILHIFQIIYAFLLVLPYYLSHIIQRRYSKYSVFDCGGWKIVISSRLSMARRQWLWKLCPWARLIMIHVIQWWQHPSLVFSILLMYTVHTLHCQPRASPTETMENETHNPHICSNTIINTPQFRKRNMREPQHWWGLWRNAELTEVFTFVLTSHLHRYLLCTVDTG